MDLPTEAEVTVFIERQQDAPAVPVLTVSFPAVTSSASPAPHSSAAAP